MTGCMRNARVEICPLMLMGFHFFCQYHVAYENFPDFSKSANWFDIKLITGSRHHGQGSLTTKWSKRSHEDVVRLGLAASRVATSKVTHTGRVSGARILELIGVSAEQIEKLCLWSVGSMQKSYLGGPPRGAMRAFTGFSEKKESYGG